MLDDLLIRLRSLFRKTRVEAELDDELRFHIEREIDKQQRSGISRDEAARRAQLVFGGEEQIRQECREARGTSLIETALQDIRYGLRGMRKNPGFFAIAVLTLALGIGASTAVFSLVNTILLKPLPYPNAGRVVMVWRESRFAGISTFPFAPSEYSILQSTPNVFESLGAFKKESFNLTGTDAPELLEGVRATAGFFPTLGVAPALGRVFTAEEDQPGHEHVVVLSHRLWQTRFGGDSGVLGRTIDLNAIGYTVIGVMPGAFAYPNQQGIDPILDLPKETQLWIPFAMVPAPKGASELGVIGLLKPGESKAQLDEGLRIYQSRLEAQYPQEKGFGSQYLPLTEQTVSDSRRPLLLLLGAVGVVLAIACANVAGLMLNRGLSRRRELTLRGALGARRGRLVRQLLTEGLMLAIAGGAAGVLLGQVTLSLVKRFGPDTIPHLHETGLDPRVIAFALGVTLIAGVLFGLAPALGATRTSMVDALKEGGQRTLGSAAAPWMRNGLLVAQVAMALVLVIAAGLLVRTFYSMLRAGGGFDAAHVVTFELPLPLPKYADINHAAETYRQLLAQVEAIPTVEAAGFTSEVPMGGPTDSTVIRLPGHPPFDPSNLPYANYSFVSPGYFAAIGAQIERGRDIGPADTLDAVHVVIINRAMAKKYFPGQDPVGMQVGVALKTVPMRTIVGVVADIRHISLRETAAPEMFVPAMQSEMKAWPSMTTMQFALRTRADDASISESVRNAIHKVDPDLPVAKFAALGALVHESMTADRFVMLLIGAFGVLALILASIGMYGVISWSVMQRTPEIGVRIALGAQRSQIFAMVLTKASSLVIAGVVLGLAGAFAVTRLMVSFLYGVRPADPTTFAVVSLILIAVAFLACFAPARRATRVNPLIALKHE